MCLPGIASEGEGTRPGDAANRRTVGGHSTVRHVPGVMGWSERHAPSAATYQEKSCQYQNTNPLHIHNRNSLLYRDGDWPTSPLWPEKLQGPEEQETCRLLNAKVALRC